MKFSFKLLWYDFWVGGFWDRERRVLYVCPLPCVVFKFSFGKVCKDCNGTGKYNYRYMYMGLDGKPIYGSEMHERSCNFCKGTGKVWS